jgi:hypothetical protein
MNLFLTTFGQIPQLTLDEISSLIDESYRALGEPMGGSVDVEVWEKAEAEQFFATHDALEGKPRIRIYVDKLRELPKSVGLAGIRRQVVHSIRHGSLRFYLIKFPDVLQKAIAEYRLTYDFGNSLLYSIGMAAKEYEVTKFLDDSGFVDEQVVYARYMLEPDPEETFSWRLASANKPQQVLYLATLLRDISCSVPLVHDEKVGDEIRQYIERKLAHVSPDARSRLQGIIYEKFGLLGADTLENINLVAKWVTEEILIHTL